MMPGTSVDIWVGLLLVITLAVLLTGSYGQIEFVATLLVVIFTILTVVTAGLLQVHPEYFTWSSVAKGLAFDVPDKGFFTAIAVFGITGVGAIELTQYPSWCVEKGYARARGWIRVIHVDILLAMVIYTFATVAFYLLGAGVLNKLELIPESSKMIENLSRLARGQCITGRQAGYNSWSGTKNNVGHVQPAGQHHVPIIDVIGELPTSIMRRKASRFRGSSEPGWTPAESGISDSLNFITFHPGNDHGCPTFALWHGLSGKPRIKPTLRLIGRHPQRNDRNQQRNRREQHVESVEASGVVANIGD